MRPRVVVVLGATATGKTALALELAERMAGEIVNADSLQAYRRLKIGTGKPSRADLARVPHHLFDILEPDQRYSAGEFARRARAAVAAVLARGRSPIIAGGSGLYLRALLDGLSPLPERDDGLRSALTARLEREGLAPLRRELTVLDRETAARLGAGDSQRIVRALEVVLATGRPLSSWIAAEPSAAPSFVATQIGLTLPRSVLYDRIDRRVRAMLAAGWSDEVRSLLDAGYGPSSPAFQAIGYRQLVRYLLTNGAPAAMVGVATDIVTATRRLAKRQETWFRRDPRIHWLDAGRRDVVPAALELLAASESGTSGEEG